MQFGAFEPSAELDFDRHRPHALNVRVDGVYMGSIPVHLYFLRRIASDPQGCEYRYELLAILRAASTMAAAVASAAAAMAAAATMATMQCRPHGWQQGSVSLSDPP